MATKKYGQETFYATVNGKDYAFYCHTTNTRCGFCHTVSTLAGDVWLQDTKVSYYNRTWERFRYESALRSAIEKCAKADQQGLVDIIIDKKAQDEHEKAEKFINAFKGEYDKLSDKNKEILANSPHIETEEQAQGVMNVMRMMNALDTITK